MSLDHKIIGEIAGQLERFYSPKEKLDYIRSEIARLDSKIYRVEDPTLEGGGVTVKVRDFEYHAKGYEIGDSDGGGGSWTDYVFECMVRKKSNCSVEVKSNSLEGLAKEVKKLWKLPADFVENLYRRNFLESRRIQATEEVAKLKQLQDD